MSTISNSCPEAGSGCLQVHLPRKYWFDLPDPSVLQMMFGNLLSMIFTTNTVWRRYSKCKCYQYYQSSTISGRTLQLREKISQTLEQPKRIRKMHQSKVWSSICLTFCTTSVFTAIQTSTSSTTSNRPRKTYEKVKFWSMKISARITV